MWVAVRNSVVTENVLETVDIPDARLPRVFYDELSLDLDLV